MEKGGRRIGESESVRVSKRESEIILYSYNYLYKK